MFDRAYIDACKDFVDNFIDLLPKKNSLIIGRLASREYAAAREKEINESGRKDKVPQMQELARSIREIKFFIKSKNCYDFKKELKSNRKFDFVFSDDVALTRLGDASRAKGGREIEIKGIPYYLNKGFQDIMDQVRHVNDQGIIAFLLEEGSLVETRLYPVDRNNEAVGVNLEDLLHTEGFYINAILGIKRADLYANQNIQNRLARKNMFIFSKREADLLFVADASGEKFNYKKLFDLLCRNKQPDCFKLNDFSSGGDIDLEHGYFLDKKDFHTYSGVEARSRVKKFAENFNTSADYRVSTLDDLMIDIASGYAPSMAPEQKNNCIQLYSSFKSISDKIVLERPPLLDRRPYYVITLNDEVLSKYVCIFLQSKLGEGLYESYLRAVGRFGYELSEENLRKIPIFIPSLYVQKQIIEAHDKIKKLQNSIDLFSDRLSSNPNAFIGESIQKIDNMLSEVGKLNDAEKIRTWIYGFETKAVEFKQTWRLPTNTLEEDIGFDQISDAINATVFKVINSYINSSGGSVVIGITDETHEVVGIEAELEHYYNKYDSVEKRVDEFDKKFKSSLDSSFGPDFIRLVDFRPVRLDGKVVYLVSCKPGDKPCFIQNPDFIKTLKGNSFYVREGSNSVPKQAEDLAKYALSRFASTL